MPTRLNIGEGRADREATHTCTCFDPPGVISTASWKGDLGHRGKPVPGGGRAIDVVSGGGPGGWRTGPYDRRGRVTPAEGRALTSGVLSFGGEGMVIGDEP